MGNSPELPPSIPPRTSRCAIASLVLGIMSFVAGCFGVLTGLVGTGLGIFAIGHMGTNAQLTGRKLAIAGIVTGSLAAILALTIYDWNAVFHGTPEPKYNLGGPAHFP